MGATDVVHPTDETLRSYGLSTLDEVTRNPSAFSS
jgi:hypothetical protein